ncbi:MAG: glycosyltransferase [Desulfuromonadales bacterium]|nr:glycosyltransferase [Desulfuromonadales bacterium]
MKPLISIVISAYNVEHYIGQCIESLLAQTLTNIEIILVDDGSTDRTGAISAEYAEKDERINYVRKENGGLGSGRNYGLELCNGEYVGFIDGDDYVHEDMYRFLLDLAYANKADIVSCLHVCFWDDGSRPDSIYPEYPFRSDVMVFDRNDPDKYKSLINYSVCNKLFLKSIPIKFPEGVIHEDIPVMFDVFSSDYKIVCTDKPYHYYRQGRIGKITMINDEKRFDIFVISEMLMNIIKRKNLNSGWSEFYSKWLIEYYLSVYSLVDTSLKNKFICIGSSEVKKLNNGILYYLRLAKKKRIRFALFYSKMNLLLRFYGDISHYFFKLKKSIF